MIITNKLYFFDDRSPTNSEKYSILEFEVKHGYW